MQAYLLELLECPLCHAALRWTIDERDGDCIEAATATCSACEATYPVREGIGLFLTPELPRDDLWEQVGSNLTRHLDENPAIAVQLLDAPLETLNPADQFLRSMTLEDQGDFAGARAAFEAAWPDLYTPEYLACAEAQYEAVIAQVDALEGDGPIVDIASGRGYLVERLAARFTRPIVATDFSPRVLRRNRRYFAHFAHCQQVSLLAFDARLTPFKSDALPVMTTNLGLPNISEPGDLLGELRRIAADGGLFLAISYFFPPDDAANMAKIEDYGLAEMLVRERALAVFQQAGWQAELAHTCTGRALPTPTSAILGVGIDGMPVAETTLEWGTIVARA